MTSPIPAWLGLLVLMSVFTAMLSLGLMLGREQIEAALRRRVVLAVLLFAVVVPVPAVAVLFVKGLGLTGAVAAGIVLMSISPGAPVALRRAIEAGGHPAFAPALHLAIVMFAVVTVPASVAILDLVFDKDFTVSPLDVARQVFVAQLLPLGLGAALRAFRPALAARIEPRLGHIANLLLLALVAVLLVVLWPLMVETGWVPFVAGMALTVCALAVGAACAGRDAAVRPSGAVAAAMRNPGLALLIATVNKLPATVVAAVFGYALGLTVVVTAFVLWQGRRRGAPPP
jgi:BASS family bile acid:Na+ symporter